MIWCMKSIPCRRGGCGVASVVMMLFLVSSCAPVISKQLRQQVDKSLSFGLLSADPENYKGKIVILGGVIIQTTPKPGETKVEIVQKNLDFFNEPENEDKSDGRFLVRADGFLDPEIYKKDRKITVAGEVIGSETRKLDELDYRYPVVKAMEMKLWPKPRPMPPPYYWGYPYYWGPYYWGPWGTGPLLLP